jgi:general secretion pathway protein G
MEQKKAKDKQAGFTFIEIMVAMMILGILIGTAAFTYIRYVSKAKVVAAMNQAQSFSIALNSYFLDCGRYPTTEQGLQALWEKPILEPVPKGWDGPYLNKKIPVDPWDKEYEYKVPGPHGLPFGIRSFGADRMEGGEGKDKDLCSWED